MLNLIKHESILIKNPLLGKNFKVQFAEKVDDYVTRHVSKSCNQVFRKS